MHGRRSLRLAQVIAAAALSLLGPSRAFASADNLAVGKKGKVFKSNDGIDVAVVPVEPAGSKKALVQITGTTSRYDGRVFLADINQWGEGKVDYKTQFKGKPFVVITVRSGRYEAYIPDFPGDIDIAYDEKKSEALRPEDVLRTYTEQPKTLP